MGNTMGFSERLAVVERAAKVTSLYHRVIQQHKQRSLALHFCPRVVDLPLPMQRFDDPFLPFGKAVINASRDLVSLYVFDVPSYLAIGAAGAVALERTIDYLNDEIPCVLHGPFAGTSFIKLLDKLAFGADALTVSASADTFRLLDAHAQIQGEWTPADAKLKLVGQNEQVVALHVVGDSLIYQHRQFDFQEALRASLQAL
jgi:hypothetical protein